MIQNEIEQQGQTQESLPKVTLHNWLNPETVNKKEVGHAIKEKTMEAIEIMYEMFPNAECELKHKNPFELLIAVILSAQATDVSVNKATPGLFAAFPTPEALAAAPVERLLLK